MPRQDEGSRPQVIATVEWLKSIGAQPVPLAFRSKAAAAKGYERDGWEAPDVGHWRRGNFGVGTKTGPKSKGMIDTDLDCPESIYFAPIFMPPTEAKIGRDTKWDSHMFYMVPEPEFVGMKFIDPINKTTILELRGDGGNQTVMPGSLHQDTGEEVRFSKPNPTVPLVPSDDIIEGAKMTALVSLIARHLWNEGSRNIAGNHIVGMLYYLDWPEEKTDKLIAAIIDYTGDDDRSRRLLVRNTYRKAQSGKKITGATSLKEYCGSDALVNKLMEWAGAPDMGFLSEYNERFAVVAIEGKFRVADLTGSAPIFFGRDDFLFFHATDKMTIVDHESGKEKKVAKAAMWLASASRRSYSNVDFMPGEDSTKGILNLWSGWAVEPSKTSKKGCAAWLRLVRDVIAGGDEEKGNWLLNWFANIVREPAIKPLTAPVIIGVEGAGKSLMLSYFGRILGDSYLPVTDPEHIHGRFNQHLSVCLLLHSEEALFAGDKKHASIIRSLITDDYRMFEPKNINAKRVKNHLRLVLTSNHERAAPVQAGDRRYTIFNLGSRRASKELIRDVIKELDGDGPAALFHYLLNEFKYDREQARENVKDEQFYVARQLNFTNIEAWWEERLQLGEVLPDPLAWAQNPSGTEGHPWPQEVSSDALWRSCIMHIRMQGGRSGELTQASLARELDKMVGLTLHRTKRASYTNPWIGEQTVDKYVREANERPRAITNMPSLTECREAFDKYIGYVVAWGNPEVQTRDPLRKTKTSDAWRPQIVNEPKHDFGPRQPEDKKP